MKLNKSHFVLLIVCIGITAFSLRETGKEENSKKQAIVAEKSRQTYIAKQREAVTQALEAVVRGDEEGEMLLAFYRTHSVFVALQGNGRFSMQPSADWNRVYDAGKEIRDFFVTPSNQSERLRNGYTSVANFQYSQSENAIWLPRAETFTGQWLGIRFAHELRHAHDFLTGLEPPYQEARGITRAFAEGELRGHALEQRLLDCVTKGAFKPAVKEFTRIHPPPPDYPRMWAYPNEGLKTFAEIDALFPPSMSPAEEDTRTGSYFVAVNFAYADILGFGDSAKVDFWINYYSSKP